MPKIRKEHSDALIYHIDHYIYGNIQFGGLTTKEKNCILAELSRQGFTDFDSNDKAHPMSEKNYIGVIQKLKHIAIDELTPVQGLGITGVYEVKKWANDLILWN